MHADDIAALADYLIDAGLRNENEDALIRGFGERFAAASGGLCCGRVLVDTLHPLYEGRAFTWVRAREDVAIFEYGDSSDGEAAEKWRATPFYRLEAGGETHLMFALSEDIVREFPILKEMRDAGGRHGLLPIDRFGGSGGIGPTRCLYSAWATEAEAGFSPGEFAALLRLAAVCARAERRDACAQRRDARKDLSRPRRRPAGAVGPHRGRRRRGDRDHALVLGPARLHAHFRRRRPRRADTHAQRRRDRLAIHWQGGNVLKLIGDGVLAIFPAAERQAACHAALRAAAKARAKMAALNARRAAAALPATDFYLGLHIGHVFYGNIGSRDRLDFTVIGPAVNEVSRIASMCRLVDQTLPMSSAFVDGQKRRRQDFLSVGRFALRGVAAPQELYTLDPTADEQPLLHKVS